MKNKRLAVAAACGVVLVCVQSHGYAAEMMLSAGGTAVAAVSPMVVSGDAASAGSLVFNFTKGAELLALESGTPAEQAIAASVVAGFTDAGDLWRLYLEDAVTVNVAINFKDLMGPLGTTSTNKISASYTSVATALGGDVTTAKDAVAVANLQPGPGLDFLTNDTSIVPVSPRVRDNDGSVNNTTLKFPRANAKALGLLAAADAGTDGTITFSDQFAWDFDRSDGIAGSTFDFVATAAHEIGHLLGFVSGVDTVDFFGGAGTGAPLDLDGTAVFSVLDLMRYSADSLDESGPPSSGKVLDLAFSGTPYFSTNAGVTNEGLFSTGVANGDGRQASHWKDGLGLGLMDPTLASGELGVITLRDVLALDVIGWDAVPEPATAVVLLMVFAPLLPSRPTRRG